LEEAVDLSSDRLLMMMMMMMMMTDQFVGIGHGKSLENSISLKLDS
jgi:hypothetical protein